MTTTDIVLTLLIIASLGQSLTTWFLIRAVTTTRYVHVDLSQRDVNQIRNAIHVRSARGPAKGRGR